jgi:endoglucanase
LAIFRDSSLDTKFDVVNVETGIVIYTGDVTGSVQTPTAGETVAYGDFSNVKEAGTYKVVAANSGESYEFKISDDVYKDIFTDIVKMLYLQRCGKELEPEYAGDFAHAACHMQEATIYGTSEKKNVTGGWHDAGDYGRYVVPGAKAVADILLAYEDYSHMFSDETGIPESGNGIPDILDEARYELEWMLKMQDKRSGGVYHKVTGLSFEGMVMPETVSDDLYIMPVSNCATGDFAAVMAMAARLYEPFDAAFSKECLASAKSALSYLEDNIGKDGYRNPDDVTTGEYPDTEDTDEYFWALSELYKTTGVSAYEDKIDSIDLTSLENGMGWQGVNLYGCYAYLTSEIQNDDIKNKLVDIFNSQITAIKENIEGDGYFSSVGEVYPWGSNMTLANNGMALLMAKRFNNDDNNYQMAKKQFDYLLGANATSYCFVTGHGTLTPQNTHHRPSQVLETSMYGMLVGGANSNLEDPYAQNVLAEKPAAKCYVDNVQSFSCNEVTVYWNSPLIYLLAGLM